MSTIEQLSSAFSELVQEQLGAFLPEIVARNKSNSKEVCATQDFCDANMLMAEAFEEVQGREPDVANENDAAVWNAAWGLSKQREFK